MKKIEYRVTVGVDTGAVEPKNLELAIDSVCGGFEKYISNFKLALSGCRLVITKVSREGAGGEKEDETWREFRESLRRSET